MGYIPANDAFYVPGIIGLSQWERDFIQKHSPKAATFEGGTFFHEDLRTNYFVSRAAKEKAVVIGVAGLNSYQLMNEREVARLNENGISLIWMTLPRPSLDMPFMQDFEKLCRAFLTSRTSPVYGLNINDAPMFLAAHSTGGAILLKLMHEQDTRRKLSHAFYGAAYVAPFLDVPFASDEHSWKIRSFRPLFWAFEKYADKHVKDRVTDLPIVKKYLTLMKNGAGFLNTPTAATPTFGQIREIQAYSRAMRKNFDPRAAGALKSVFMAGDHDPFTCYKTTKHLAERIPGADFEPAHGAGHDPIYDRPELLQKFIDRLNQCVEAHAEKRQHHSQTPTVIESLYGTESLEDIMAPGLRDRARLALQSGTRSLYSFAGFL